MPPEYDGSIEVQHSRGNVVLIFKQNGEAIQSHRMTPANARILAELLKDMARGADRDMPAAGAPPFRFDDWR